MSFEAGESSSASEFTITEDNVRMAFLKAAFDPGHPEEFKSPLWNHLTFFGPSKMGELTHQI